MFRLVTRFYTFFSMCKSLKFEQYYIFTISVFHSEVQSELFCIYSTHNFCNSLLFGSYIFPTKHLFGLTLCRCNENIFGFLMIDGQIKKWTKIWTHFYLAGTLAVALDLWWATARHLQGMKDIPGIYSVKYYI